MISSAIQKIASDRGCDAVVHLGTAKEIATYQNARGLRLVRPLSSKCFRE